MIYTGRPQQQQPSTSHGHQRLASSGSVSHGATPNKRAVTAQTRAAQIAHVYATPLGMILPPPSAAVATSTHPHSARSATHISHVFPPTPLATAALVAGFAITPAEARSRWSEAQANAWYARQPWLVGANLWGLEWRPIFFVNVPIGIVAIALSHFYVKESKSAGAQKLDIPGALICGLALFLLIFSLFYSRWLVEPPAPCIYFTSI